MNNKHNNNNKLKPKKSFTDIIKDIFSTKPNWNFAAHKSKHASPFKFYLSIVGKAVLITFITIKMIQFHYYLNASMVLMPEEVYTEIKNDKLKNVSSKDLDDFIDSRVNRYLEQKNKNN